MRDLVRAAGIARQHDGDLPVVRCRRRKLVPRAHTRNGRIDPRAVGLMRDMRELQIAITLARGLEADDTGMQPSVDLRQHHVHGKIGWRQAAQRSSPVLAPRGRERDLEHRTGGGLERRPSIVTNGRKRGRVDDHGRRPLRKMRLEPVRDARRFQRRCERAPGIEAPLSQRRYQRVDRAGIGRSEIRAIKSHERMRRPVRWRQRYERALGGIVERHLGNLGLAEHRPGIESRCQRQLRDRDLCGYGAAGIAQHPQSSKRRDRHSRERIEPRILATVGRKDRKRDATRFCELMQRSDAILPIGFTADQANQNPLCAGQRPIDIGIDRERMAQRDQIGEPQRRQALATAPPAGGECREIAVGEREYDQVGRILTEIDGCRGLLQTMALAEDDVHLSPP